MKRLLRILALVLALTLANFSSAQGDDLPDAAYVDGVIGHAQSYSLSCESRSAADWAAFWGVEVSETEFLESLPRSDNPDEGFVGDPNDPWGRIPPKGYGVHADPVAETLQQFGLEADGRTNLSWDELRAEIAAGRPVIVWVIGQMWAGTPLKYEAVDGKIASVALFEHTMILTGYSADTVQVLDAYSGEYQTYWLETFLRSWSVLGNMAVFGSGKVQADEEPQPEFLPEPQSGSYIVQEGEFLVELAERFGTTWQELAAHNSIVYPFTIYPGQVLQLPGGDAPAEETNPAATAPTQAGPYRAHLPVVERYFVTVATQPMSPPETQASAWLNVMYLPYVFHLGQLLK